MKAKLTLLALVMLSLPALAEDSSMCFWTQKWMESSNMYQTFEGNYEKILHNYDWHYNNRKQLHETAQNYLSQLEIQNAFYIDPELEDYLYQLIYQIHPETFPIHQKVQLNVKMIKSVLPETFSFANGTILISTGMLSLLHSEDELIAVLAREIAHLSLDHNVETYTALQTKQTIASIIGTGVYVASVANSLDNNRSFWEADYLGSFVGAGAEILSYGLLSAMGLGYNRARVYDADEIAQEWMMQNHRDPYALPTVIRRLQFFESEHRGTSRELSDNRFFLKNRFENIVKEKKFKLEANGCKLMPLDKIFDTRISECLKTNSKLLVAEEAYTEAIPFLNRSIQSNWTSGESYLLKAMALRHTRYSNEDNRTILQVLQKAEENATTDLPWIWSEKGLIHLRLQEYQEALNAFTKFEEYFSAEQSETTLWARKMIAKLRNKITYNE